MPGLCQLNDLLTTIPQCLDNAGVKMIRVIRACDIDFEYLNDNLDYYFNTTTYQFNYALPIKNYKPWGTLKPDYNDVRRKVTVPIEKKYSDIALSSMRFRGYLTADKMAQIKRINELCVVTLLLNGQIIVDGLDYYYLTNKIQVTKFIAPRFKEITEDTQIFDSSIGINTILSIEGRQSTKGFRGLFTWESMIQSNEYGVFVADDLFTFITDDGTLFSFR
jgi:hypothetical protein